MRTSGPQDSSKGTKHASPLPRWVHLLLRLVIPEHVRAVVMTDIESAYRRDVERLGLVRARRRLLAELAPWHLLALRHTVRQTRHRNLDGRGMMACVDDLRFAARALLRSPAFAGVSVLTLALAIGANTAVFSMVDTFVLRALPIPDADRTYEVYETAPVTGDYGRVSWAEFLDWRERSTLFERMVAFEEGGVTLSQGNRADWLPGGLVSRDYFDLVGAQPFLGRFFSPVEHLDDASPVAVMSYRLWVNRFEADPDMIGSTIVLDYEAHEVVGVAAPHAGDLTANRLLDRTDPTDIWRPIERVPFWSGRANHWLDVAVRVAPGVGPTAALEELSAIVVRLNEEHGTSRGVAIVPLGERFGGDSAALLLALLGAVGLVMLIATANVAALGLARATTRSKEFTVRAAIGAGRGRLFRMAIGEALLITGLAVGLGVGTGWLGIQILVGIWFEGAPLAQEVALNWRVLAFTGVVGSLGAVLVGAPPAFQVMRTSVHGMLGRNSLGVTSGGAGRHGRNLLSVGQFALSVVLLVGAGLMIQSLVGLLNVDTGVDPENLLTFEMNITENRFPDDAEIRGMYDDLTERLRSVPGVVSAASSFSNPLTSPFSSLLGIEGRDPFPEGQAPRALLKGVDMHYFSTVGSRLIRGRSFLPEDHTAPEIVALINETLAERYWPDSDPVGQRLINGGNPIRIIGVVEDVRLGGLDLEPDLQNYYEIDDTRPRTLTVRTTADPEQMIPILRREVFEATGLPIYLVNTLDDLLTSASANRRTGAMLLGTLSVLALVLSAVGIFSVLSYTVSQRRREMGIRLALGATGSRVTKLILRQGMTAAVAGLVLGVMLALGLTRFLQGQLYGVSATDPRTFIGACVTLAAVAFAGCYLPARQAARCDLIDAMREE